MKKQLKENQLDIIRHSTSHILAAAVLEKFPKAKLGIGPTIENGFYYDFDFQYADTRGSKKTRINADKISVNQHTYQRKSAIAEGDLGEIEKRMRNLIKKDLKFKKEIILYAEAKKLFKDQPYKLELIKELQKNKKPIAIYTTLAQYQHKSAFVDLCKGPHVKSTKEINPDAFKLTKIAGAYWRGNEKNPMLTRIYGVAFETKKELDEYLTKLENAQKCDHRVLGERLELFMFDEEIGKGLPLLLPKGYFIRRQLENYIYELEKRNNYFHVLTPILAKEDLYKKSGHLAHYKDDMYAPIVIEDEKYYLKPMNCPHHHAIYKRQKRSYRDLPLRIAEFGHVHRFERSGVLTGLIRVRGFTQNDAHIYTDEENLEKEIINVIKLTEEVYKTFGLKDYWYRLSLPDFKNKEKFGDIKNKKMWERGSNFLKKALKDSGHKFIEAIGEATFYGPKIDIQIKDVWDREDSIGTVQVDYYSAPRFNLYYVDKKGKEQSVIIIHRAIMGAFERFMAFLLEKSCGALPLWLSPIQVEIINVGSAHRQYANFINQQLTTNNIRTNLSDENLTVSRRIRDAEIQKIPYILVVGDKEVKNKTVNVRHRGQPSFAPADAPPSPKQLRLRRPSKALAGKKATAGKEGLSTEAKAKVEEIKIDKLIEKLQKEIKDKTL